MINALKESPDYELHPLATQTAAFFNEAVRRPVERRRGTVLAEFISPPPGPAGAMRRVKSRCLLIKDYRRKISRERNNHRCIQRLS